LVWFGLLSARRLRRHYSGSSPKIDGRHFNSSFPKIFPRFAATRDWRYTRQSGLDVCIGNRIDDPPRCENKNYGVRLMCDRVALR
jgi:hypothetical protein